MHCAFTMSCGECAGGPGLPEAGGDSTNMGWGGALQPCVLVGIAVWESAAGFKVFKAFAPVLKKNAACLC